MKIGFIEIEENEQPRSSIRDASKSNIGMALQNTALGIDLKDRNLDVYDNQGRRFFIAGDKENAEPISELLA